MLMITPPTTLVEFLQRMIGTTEVLGQDDRLQGPLLKTSQIEEGVQAVSAADGQLEHG